MTLSLLRLDHFRALDPPRAPLSSAPTAAQTSPTPLTVGLAPLAPRVAIPDRVASAKPALQAELEANLARTRLGAPPVHAEPGEIKRTRQERFDEMTHNPVAKADGFHDAMVDELANEGGFIEQSLPTLRRQSAVRIVPRTTEDIAMAHATIERARVDAGSADPAVAEAAERTIKRTERDFRSAFIAEGLVRDQAPMVADKLYTPAMRAQYAKLESEVRSDPVAHASLQDLAIRGTLFSAPPGGKTLADVLSQPLDPAIDRSRYVGELVQELACPDRIMQGARGTCTVTAVQRALAREEPRTYARVAMELASKEGTTKLPGGATLSREAGTERDDGSRRTGPSRVVQSALMELGNGDWSYDNARDAHTKAGEKDARGGLRNEETARLASQCFGGEYEIVGIKRAGAARSKPGEPPATDHPAYFAQSAVATGKPVFMGLFLPEGHMTEARGTTTMGPRTHVEVSDPGGATYLIHELAADADRIKYFIVPRGAGSAFRY